jgi:hypothetical protein
MFNMRAHLHLSHPPLSRRASPNLSWSFVTTAQPTGRESLVRSQLRSLVGALVEDAQRDGE